MNVTDHITARGGWLLADEYDVDGAPRRIARDYKSRGFYVQRDDHTYDVTRCRVEGSHDEPATPAEVRAVRDAYARGDVRRWRFDDATGLGEVVGGELTVPVPAATTPEAIVDTCLLMLGEVGPDPDPAVRAELERMAADGPTWSDRPAPMPPPPPSTPPLVLALTLGLLPDAEAIGDLAATLRNLATPIAEPGFPPEDAVEVARRLVTLAEGLERAARVRRRVEDSPPVGPPPGAVVRNLPCSYEPPYGSDDDIPDNADTREETP